MRGLGKLAANPGCPAAAAAFATKQYLLSSSHTFSTFSGDGGRGRGRGSSPPPKHAPGHRVPGQTEAAAEEEDTFASPGLGHGRGQPVLPSSPVLPSFSSWMSSAKPSTAGRGRGQPPPSPATETPDSQTKKPIFFRREDSESHSGKTQFSDNEEVASLPPSLSPVLSGSGRGKPTKPAVSDVRSSEENRHLRPRASVGSPTQRKGPVPMEPGASPSQPKLGREEAVRKAVEVLSRGGTAGGGRGGRGRGRGLAGGRGRGRGRGGRFRDASEEFDLYLGDNADGEKLAKRLGEENMKKLEEGFEELSWDVLPSPVEDAYLDALHTNNMIEYEPEYLMEFDTNPDIDEKPPMSLRDALEKVKPFLMAYDGIQSQEEWEDIMRETMEKLPQMKELMDMYCGPDRVTAKQQQQELERVAKTLPANVPSSVQRFTDRAVLSLQSNPGWGFDKKCQFMDKLVWEVSQQYK